MKTIRFRTRVASLLSAILLVLQISPALAFGLQGASQNHKTFEVTFTKWVTGTNSSGFALLAGFTGGDVVGDFAGEVLYRKVSTNGRNTQLQPIYEVIAGQHSFTALIQGGQNNLTGKAVFDGIIFDGWRTGARVQVEYQRMTNCAFAPPGTCFQGIIRILPDSQP
jgi:hypothetical protein